MPRLLVIAALGLFLTACATAPLDEPDDDTDYGPDTPPDLSGLDEPEPQDEPLSRYGNPATYEVFGQQYQVMSSEDARGFTEEGIASWYGKKFHGRRTSSGEPYDMYTLTAAHTQLPLPTYVRVTNQNNDKSVIVRVNDRGPFADNRIIDLSYAAADRIDMVDDGTAPVRIETLSNTFDPDNPPTTAEDNGGEQQQAESEPSEPSSESAVTASARDVPDRPTAEDDEPESDAADNGATDAGYLLQVGAFSERGNAEALKERLTADGIRPVAVSESDGVHRVRVGPMDSREALDEAANALQNAGFRDSHVITN
ncbi:septal ring lytic transglycosylase RlpA family protein [Aquisalimonas sp.]|uniref:septal ring lytic transglycosylase RlpA family protein n=1 Tax=unclassified Aquisalimonas TaxID=2644645 RepID=UPI0025BE30F2|nr:septal ring lytic transglycosylase RlpA family protein [Aquisalimonas sp.]